MTHATTAVTVTDLNPEDVRLIRDPLGAGLSSLAVAAVHIDLTRGWSQPDRAERIAALEKLARTARQAAHELRRQDEQVRRP
ncbi:hypothetical protein SUDANB121_02916 [Nocardiopsis dassonvillei]|uniref:hypothetical protein n=1 Tax=Nocardiopsis dassonvillei TaxID=2014 RepID=UPI003F5578DB